MIPRTCIAVSVLALAACSTTPSTAEVSSMEAVPAQLTPAPPRPVEIVEIPKAIPFPNQLKPLPELSPPLPVVAPKVSVQEANAAARIEPIPSGFINAVQVWPYTEGALYQLYTTPGRVTDIALEPGEDIVDISTPDTVRWIVGDSRSGAGAQERRHIIVKPTRADLQTNLTIFTTRRTYHLEVRATSETWMAAVSWDYPQQRLANLRAENKKAIAAEPVANGIALDNLHFRYEITGDRSSWRPLRAFDDGNKVYIQFPDSIAQDDLPPLFVTGRDGEPQLVNYRVKIPYLIIDRLFSAAELRFGGKDAEVVRVVRTDLAKRKRAKGESS